LLIAAVVGIVALAYPFDDDSPQPVRTEAPAPVPADGALLQVRGSPRVYVVKAGAKFAIPRGQRAVFGYAPEGTRTISAAALRDRTRRSHASTPSWPVSAVSGRCSTMGSRSMVRS
jgi:hypothetical protein